MDNSKKNNNNNNRLISKILDNIISHTNFFQYPSYCTITLTMAKKKNLRLLFSFYCEDCKIYIHQNLPVVNKIKLTT